MKIKTYTFILLFGLIFCNYALADIFSDEEPTINIPKNMSRADYADTFYRVEKENTANPLRLTIKKDLSASMFAIEVSGKTYNFNLNKAKIVDDLLIFNFKTVSKQKRYKMILSGVKEGNTKKLFGTVLIYHNDVLSTSDGMYFLNHR